MAELTGQPAGACQGRGIGTLPIGALSIAVPDTDAPGLRARPGEPDPRGRLTW